MAQAAWVSDRLAQEHPEIAVVIVPITTTGDTDRVSPLSSLTEVGAFVRAVQQALLDGRADLAVHSLKDLPVQGPPELTMIYPPREDPADVLCGFSLSDLPARGRVGTSSPRRAAQLKLLRGDLEVVDIRGNVDTRLDRVESGDFDAIVLAAAGLKRLGLGRHISQRLSLDEMVPAPGQAALAVEARQGSHAWELASVLDHRPTREAVEIERRLLELTAAGCRSALGAWARAANGTLTMTAFVEDERGPRRATGQDSDPLALVAGMREELGI